MRANDATRRLRIPGSLDQDQVPRYDERVATPYPSSFKRQKKNFTQGPGGPVTVRQMSDEELQLARARSGLGWKPIKLKWATDCKVCARRLYEGHLAYFHVRHKQILCARCRHEIPQEKSVNHAIPKSPAYKGSNRAARKLFK